MSDTKHVTAYRNQSLSPFGSNVASATTYRRIERIAAAAHLVTNGVPEHEPIRRSIRSKSLEALARSVSLREGFRAAGPEQVTDVIADLLELVTLFEVANAAGYLSQMNVEVLGRACADTAAYMRQQEDSAASEGIRFEDQYFTPPAPSMQASAPNQARRVKDISIGQKENSAGRRKSHASARKMADKRDRYEAVRNVVQEKKRVSIKDVMEAVPGYSEKTIQRELLSLARTGVVKKEGERRWSTYVLVE